MKSGHKRSRKLSQRVIFLFKGFTKIFAFPQGVLCKSGLTAKAIGYDSDVSREKVPRLSLERGREKKSLSFFNFFFPDQFNLFRTINSVVTGRNQTSKRVVCFAAWGQGKVCGGKCQGFELALQLGSLCSPSWLAQHSEAPGQQHCAHKQGCF